MNNEKFKIKVAPKSTLLDNKEDFQLSCLKNFIKEKYKDKRIKSIKPIKNIEKLGCYGLTVEYKIELEDDFIEGVCYKGKKIKRSEYLKLEKEEPEMVSYWNENIKKK